MRDSSSVLPRSRVCASASAPAAPPGSALLALNCGAGGGAGGAGAVSKSSRGATTRGPKDASCRQVGGRSGGGGVRHAWALITWAMDSA